MSRRILLVVVPPVDELDLVGPVEVFGTANRLLANGRAPYDIEVVTNARHRRVAGQHGLTFVAERSCRDVRGTPDSALVVCGLEARTARDPALFAWLREIAPRVRRLGAVCVGAYLLAEAGLLDGRRATVHWKYAQEMARRYPRVSVDPKPIWVQDGNLFTSAGLSAGIDLALAWVEQDFGVAAALKVARELVLFLRRPGGQDQFSALLSVRAPETKALHRVQVWMAENLEQPLKVARLADEAAMSPRNFARVFGRELGTTPARYLAGLRVEAARRLLEQTDKGLPEVARASGFGSADVMRRVFERALGTTPRRYRSHFHRPGAAAR